MFSDCVFVKHNLSGFNKAEVRRCTLSHPSMFVFVASALVIVTVIAPSPNVVIKPTAITSTKRYCTLIKLQRRENSVAFPDQGLPKL
jgi:hypothetical protein